MHITDFSISMNTARGSFHKNDLVHWVNDGSRWCGFAVGFVKATCANGDVEFLCIARVCRLVGQLAMGEAWTEGPRCLVAAQLIIEGLPFFADGVHIFPRFPKRG